MSFKIENAQSINDLKEKLAYKLKTAPEFLFTYPELTLDSLNFIDKTDVVNIPLKQVLSSEQENVIVIDVFNYVKDLTTLDDINGTVNILLEWDENNSESIFKPLYLNKFNQIYSPMVDTYLLAFQSEIPEIIEYNKSNSFEEIETIVSNFEDKITSFLENYSLLTEDQTVSEIIAENKKYTKDILSQTLTVTLDLNDPELAYYDLDVLFNSVKLNTSYQLAIYKDLAKIHKDLDCSVNINYNTFNSINIYSNVNSEYDKPEIKIYIENNYAKFEFKNSDYEKDQIINILKNLLDFDSFDLTEKSESPQLSNITAIINYPDTYINLYILLDLFLVNTNNIPVYKNILNKFSATEKVFTDKMFSCRLIYKTASNHLVVANVKQICYTVQKIKTNSSVLVNNCDKNLQISITKCKNGDDLDEFLRDFNIVISKIYETQKDLIVASYEEMGININIINSTTEINFSANNMPCKLEKGSEEKQFLATIYPYLFKPEPIKQSYQRDDFRLIENIKGTNYLSSCTKRPIVISDEEAQQKIIDNGGVEPISLKKYPENRIQMPLRKDIPANKKPFIEPMWFYCESKEDIQNRGDFDKLSDREKKSADSTRLGFITNNSVTPTPGVDTVTGEQVKLNLPCCYKPLSKTTSASKIPKTGESMVKNGNLGELPGAINKLLIESAEGEYKSFKRYGVVNTSKSITKKDVRESFLQCMITATNKLDKLDEIKKSLILYIPLAKQSLPHMKIDEIYDKYFSENATEYIDPFYFLRMFECLFTCNIVVLRRDSIGDTNKSTQISFVTPYFKHVLYKNEYESYTTKVSLHRKTVIIYEHRGGAPTPFYSCELITATDDVQLSMIYPFNRSLMENLDEAQEFCFDCRVIDSDLKYSKRLDFPELWRWDSIIKFEKQYIDKYGKTRQLLAVLKDQSLNEFPFIINVSPIEPLPIICVSEKPLELSEEMSDDDWVEVYNAINDLINVRNYPGEISFDSNTKTIFGELGLIYFEIEKNFSVKSAEPISEISNYNNLKNIALSLKSLFIWLFSNFISDDTVENKSIEKFLELKTIQVDNCNYENPTEFLSIEKNPGYFVEGKLKLEKNSSIPERLIYYLNIESRNIEKLKDYKNRYIIENYFGNIENYKIYNDQVITKILPDNYNNSSNFKILQLNEWFEELLGKPLTESFEVSMLYGIKLAEIAKIISTSLMRGRINVNKIKLAEVSYVDLDQDTKPVISEKVKNNINIYNKCLQNNIPNSENYTLDYNKFKTILSITKNINNIYNSICAVQKYITTIPNFVNKNIKEKIAFNDKHKIHNSFQKDSNGVYLVSNYYTDNKLSLCSNMTRTEDALKSAITWNNYRSFYKSTRRSNINFSKYPIVRLLPNSENNYTVSKINEGLPEEKTAKVAFVFDTAQVTPVIN